MKPYYPFADKATAALHEACGASGLFDDRLINELLSMGANINAMCDEGFTPLMRAAFHGAAEKVDHLLACGAVNSAAHADSGSKAMALAADNGHPHVARKLMRAVTAVRSPNHRP